jgi:putative transposase
MNINRSMNKGYNHKRIYRLMATVGMKSVIRKKKKNYIMSTPQFTAENILNREFTADRPNRKWLSDVTEFKLLNGQKAYLSAILDLGDNSIVAYSLGHSNNNDLVFRSFDQAVADNPDASPLFHSDRGFQYTNFIFKNKLDRIRAVQSMSRVSRCIDNGPMEGFWGTIKSEMYYLQKFHDFDELKHAIDEYIIFYNFKRLQKNLKGLAPMEFRSQSLAV